MNVIKDTLEPEDWREFRKLGHKMMDDTIDFLENIRSSSFTPPTEESVKALMAPLSDEGESVEKIYELFQRHYLPHSVRVVSPHFWGFVVGTSSPFAMLSSMLSTSLNMSDFAFSVHDIIYKQSLNWIKELLDFPVEASGVFVSGGSEANFTGLAVARNSKAEVDIKRKGMQNVSRRMTLYCSEEAHDCLDRSVELLGLGNDALRWIPTDENHQMNISALEKEIRLDRENGFYPFCVIGTAGSVHTGAFDNLNALADLCKRESLWFHVDGAFGSWVKLSPTHRHLADGLERADSLAVDLHKWMNMPYAIACTIVKDKRAHF